MKHTIRATAQCRHCGNSVLEVSDEHADDPIAKCSKCGAVLGPIDSIQRRMRGEPHTPVDVEIVIDSGFIHKD